MQAPSLKLQQVKAWVLTSLDNPSCSIRYNTNFNTASLLTGWAWGAGSCQTWVKGRIKENEGRGKKFPVEIRLGEDPCVFKRSTVNLTPLGGFQYRIYQTVLHLHKAATWKNVYFDTEAETYEHCWFIQELPASNLWQTSTQEGAVQENCLVSFLKFSWSIKLWSWVSALLKSQFSEAYFFTRIWTSNITIKLGGTSL